MVELIEQAKGAIIGLAVGDALGQPTEGKSRVEIKETWDWITDFLEEEPVGSDDTEYAVFNAELLIKHGKDLTSDKIAQAWKEEIISQRSGFKGAGFSEMAAIENLRAGISPPLSGKHIHSWSDGLAMRVIPFGIVAAGNPNWAAEFATRDGEVTHSGEGILGGQVVAAAVAAAMTGASNEDIFAIVLDLLPEDSWTYRAISRGIKIGSQADNVWDSLKPLSQELIIDYYPWPDLGPEALGLTFGLLAAAGNNFRDAVLGGVNIGRDTDTIAGIAGAIIGARIGIKDIPHEWRTQIKEVKGICIHTVDGKNLRDIADKLGELAEQWREDS